MTVDSKTDGVAIEIVDGVEVLKECVSNEEQVLVFTWKSAFVDNEIALFVARFIQILFRVDFKNVVTHLESNWLNSWCNIFA